MAFLSLSNKASIKAKALNAEQAAETAYSARLSQGYGSGGDAQVEIDDKDDEWYDTSGTSSEDPSPVKPTKARKMSHEADSGNSVVSVKNAAELAEEALLPYIPPLLGLDLPPCGPEMQVAYELLVHRLRKHWLGHHGHLSAIDIVHKVQAELRNQNYLWPSSSLKGRNKRRKPWCREMVFKHQLEWIDYFQREAENQDPELMTESELWEQKKESDVPRELKIQVERRDILRLWEEWNHKKRAKVKSLQNPGVDAENTMVVSFSNEDTSKDTSDSISSTKTKP